MHMKILYVTSEAAPYAASGGLGDVMGSLPQEIKKLGDHEVAVILPLYKQVGEQHRAMMEKVAEFTIPYAWRRSECAIYRLTAMGVDY